MEIRRLQESDSIEELTSLLHRAYKRLLDLGFNYLATQQSADVTRDRASSGECYVAVDNGKMVATLTFYPQMETGDCEWYERPDVASFGQFAVEPEYQGQGIGRALIDLAEQRARECQAGELALDTAEGANHLLELYTKAGYRHVGYAQWQDANYRSVILSKSLDRGS